MADVTVAATTFSLPTTSAIFSSFSTPLLKHTIGGMSSAHGRMASSAPSVSNDFSAKMAASNGP